MQLVVENPEIPYLLVCGDVMRLCENYGYVSWVCISGAGGIAVVQFLDSGTATQAVRQLHGVRLPDAPGMLHASVMDDLVSE